MHVAGFGAYDAAGHRGGEVEGVSDGKHRLADLHQVAVAEGYVGQTVKVHLDDGKVGGGVVTHEAGRNLTLVVEGHGDALSVLHHVVVGEDIAVGSDYDSRTIGTIHLTLHTLLDDETKEGLVERRELGHLGLDVDHGVDGRRRHVGEISQSQARRFTHALLLPDYLLGLLFVFLGAGLQHEARHGDSQQNASFHLF